MEPLLGTEAATCFLPASEIPKAAKELPKGIPPPKPEDFPGDPVGFQEAMNGWALLHGEENKAIKHRLGEPDEAEKEKILLSMAGQDPTGGT